MKNTSTHRPWLTSFLRRPTFLPPVWWRALLTTMACHLLLTLCFTRWKDTFPLTALLLSLLTGGLLTWTVSPLFSGASSTAAAKPPASGCRYLMVQSADRCLSVPVEQVCCIYRVGRHTLLRTFDRAEYLLPQSLREVMEQLEGHMFFQVNRRLILQRKTCVSYKTASYGKLLLTLHPPLSEPVTVSQGKAPAFRKWMAG